MSLDGYVIHVSCRPPTGGGDGGEVLTLLMSVRRPSESAASWRREAEGRPPVLCLGERFLGEIMDRALENGYKVRVDLADVNEPTGPIWCSTPGEFSKVILDICNAKTGKLYPVSAWAIPDDWPGIEAVEIAVTNRDNEDVWYSALSAGAIHFNAFTTSCDFLVGANTGHKLIKWAKASASHSPIPVEWYDFQGRPTE